MRPPLFRQHRPDVTLMDLRLPHAAASTTGRDPQEFPDARVVMLTTFEGDVEIQRALRRGRGVTS